MYLDIIDFEFNEIENKFFISTNKCILISVFKPSFETFKMFN